MSEPIGLCWVTVYCMDCGYKTGYNGCKPYTQPTKCKKCDGTMVHNEKESESIRNLHTLLEKHASKLSQDSKES